MQMKYEVHTKVTFYNDEFFKYILCSDVWKHLSLYKVYKFLFTLWLLWAIYLLFFSGEHAVHFSRVYTWIIYFYYNCTTVGPVVVMISFLTTLQGFMTTTKKKEYKYIHLNDRHKIPENELYVHVFQKNKLFIFIISIE